MIPTSAPSVEQRLVWFSMLIMSKAIQLTRWGVQDTVCIVNIYTLFINHSLDGSVIMFKKIIKGIKDIFLPEPPLYLTHSRELARLGRHKLMDEEYVVHTIKELEPTALINGGTARCWAVWGYKAQSSKESAKRC